MRIVKKCVVPIGFVLLAGFSTQSLAAGTCPVDGSDTVVPLSSFDPPPQAGTPKLTPDDVITFLNEKNITTMKGFLDVMPDHMLKNFALIEHTETPGKSSIEYPRILMFGSDARFMVNIPTDPTDPDYEKLDVSYRHDDGNWEFSQFDFTTTPATLNKNPASCIQCHGSPARPFWQQYLNWPGVFGDDDSDTNAPETLEPRHARRFRELKTGQGNPDRFHNLLWEDRYEDYRAQHLKDNVYGFAMSIFNMAIASQVAEGVSLRLESHPNWTDVRHEFLYSQYCDRRARLAGPEQKDKIGQLIDSLGGSGNTIIDFYAALGMDVDQEFKIHWLRTDPTPPADDYNINTDSFWGVMSGLILDDLRQADPNIKNILQSGPNNFGVFGCPNLGRSTDEVLDYKMLHYYKIRGEARQQVQETFFDVDISRTDQVVTDQVRAPLCNYLASNLDTSIPDSNNGNKLPIANANGPYSGQVHTSISFSSNGSSDPDGSITAYSWDFGDGNSSPLASPDHTYTSTGLFNAKLTVTDDNGDSRADTATVTIISGDVSGLENVCLTEEPHPSNEHQLISADAVCVPASTNPNNIQYYWIYVPEDTSSIQINSGYGSGNGNVYYKSSTWATSTTYDQNSSNPDNTESITVFNPSSGYRYISVIGAHLGMTLQVALEY
ncbi:PKD domain-containing protein [Microbulbifer spongiae]|uniref:PKD domain-containing protein n=1 Tax=Microbulbifer spongiae TaxID=2944933 RepID=A0ABY9EJR5_9GAMM|nr:PKD domain-containing protein [Microbulbifer sp. MI-G]WKD51561.1 PKD domain-containing protein [Microbulbifer sp. MI-G]